MKPRDRLNQAQNAVVRWEAVKARAEQSGTDMRAWSNSWWAAFAGTWYVIAWNYSWSIVLWLASGEIGERPAQDHSAWYGSPSVVQRVEAGEVLQSAGAASDPDWDFWAQPVASGWVTRDDVRRYSTSARWLALADVWRRIGCAVASTCADCGDQLVRCVRECGCGGALICLDTRCTALPIRSPVSY